jgi:hypothetical protein
MGRDAMKFWELASVMGEEEPVLEAVLRQNEWQKYHAWYQTYDQLVTSQDRERLDTILPDALIKDVLGKARLRYYLDETSFPEQSILRGRRVNDADVEMSALTAFERFGGMVLEDTLEKGSYRVN